MHAIRSISIQWLLKSSQAFPSTRQKQFGSGTSLNHCVLASSLHKLSKKLSLQQKRENRMHATHHALLPRQSNTRSLFTWRGYSQTQRHVAESQAPGPAVHWRRTCRRALPSTSLPHYTCTTISTRAVPIDRSTSEVGLVLKWWCDVTERRYK